MKLWRVCQGNSWDTLPLNTPSNPAIISSCSGLNGTKLISEVSERQLSPKLTWKGNPHLVSCLLILTSWRKSFCVPKSLLLREKIIFKGLLFQMWSLFRLTVSPGNLLKMLIPGSYSRTTEWECLGVAPKNWCSNKLSKWFLGTQSLRSVALKHSANTAASLELTHSTGATFHHVIQENSISIQGNRKFTQRHSCQSLHFKIEKIFREFHCGSAKNNHNIS